MTSEGSARSPCLSGNELGDSGLGFVNETGRVSLMRWVLINPQSLRLSFVNQHGSAPYPMSQLPSLIASPSVDPNLSVSEREGDAALCLARAVETGSLVVSFWVKPKRLPEGEESQAITLDEHS